MKTKLKAPNVGAPVELWGPGNVWHGMAGTVSGYVRFNGQRLAVVTGAMPGEKRANGLTLLCHPDNLRDSWRGIL